MENRVLTRIKSQRLKRGIDFILIYFNNFSTNQVSSIGAESAYYFLFSLFPLMIFLISILPLFNIDTNLILTYIDALPSQLAGPLAVIVDQVFEQLDTTTLTLSLVFSIWSASTAVSCLINKINIIYHQSATRNTIISRLIGMLLTVFFVLTVIIAVILYGFDGTIAEHLPIPGVSLVLNILKFLLIPSLFIFLFAVLYYVGAGRGQKIVNILPGAIFSAVIFVFFTSLFFNFMPIVARSYVKYGPLASVMIMLLWFYSIGLIIVLGPIFNLSLAEFKHKYQSEG